MLRIIEDSRQQIGQHEHKNNYFSHKNIKVCRCKLPVGDYALFPTVSIDTKKNMAEIAANIGGAEHVRFREECKLAKEFGCKLIILVENTEHIRSIEDVATWKNPRARYDKRSITGARLSKAMKTMSERYDVEFMFCDPADAGSIIEGILTDERNIHESTEHPSE